MPVSKRVRFEVLRRDGNRCRYCGTAAADGTGLTIDHVTPVALGGTDDPSNLVAACKDCNAGKTSTSPDGPLVADVEADAMRWAGAMKMASALATIKHYARLDKLKTFDQEWSSWNDRYRRPIPRPADWENSIDSLLAAGLEVEDLLPLVKVAMNSKADDTWRYFCGCAWKTLSKRQEEAKAYLRSQDEKGKCANCGHEDCEAESAQACAVEEANINGWRDGYEGAEKRWAFSDEPSRLLAAVVDHGYAEVATVVAADWRGGIPWRILWAA